MKNKAEDTVTLTTKEQLDRKMSAKVYYRFKVEVSGFISMVGSALLLNRLTR